ncbi:MAG: GDSL-type esterase/lipase family protein [Candidatus Firestonebacteria bacterium]
MAIADKKTYLNALKKIMKAKWPANRTVKIVCHGHSVPAGYFKTPIVDTFNSYPHLMHLALKKKYPFAVLNVSVTAIGGETSLAGAKRFKKDVLALRPDILTIDYSLNDRGLGLNVAKQAWSRMIKAAKKEGIKVLLLSPTPDSREAIKDLSAPLHRHTAQVKKLAGKFSIGFVDSYKLFAKKAFKGEKVEKYLSQVNHPNKRGHILVAKELIKWF